MSNARAARGLGEANDMLQAICVHGEHVWANVTMDPLEEIPASGRDIRPKLDPNKLCTVNRGCQVASDLELAPTCLQHASG
jgi:hypothetical protein